VREPDVPAGDLENTSGLRRVQPVLRELFVTARSQNEADGGMRGRGHYQRHVLACCRQAAEPAPRQRLKRVRDRERLAGASPAAARAEGRSEFQREVGISSRRLAQLDDVRPAPLEAALVTQQGRQGVNAERPDVD
jgi:hypothetical protein